MMNVYEIQKRIAQRPPFQMIDKVLEIVPNESAIGIKNLSVNEPFFGGHFPDMPIMPGVLLIESAAQLCSLVIENDGVDTSGVYMLLKVNEFKFVKPAIPGDTLEISVKKTQAGGTLTYFDAVIKSGDQVKAKGSMVFTKVPKEQIN